MAKRETQETVMLGEIRAWDGRSAAAIRGVFDRYGGEAWFLDALIGGMADEGLERGATWLLKHALEGGSELTKGQVEGVYRCAEGLGHWEAKLHVLQSMGWMPVGGRQAKRVARFVEGCLGHERPFVRAWAYSGFHCLARWQPRYREEALALLEDALEAERAASVLARVRKLVKAGFPED